MAKYENFARKLCLPHGAVVWAYLFKNTDSLIVRPINQKPVKGRIGHDSILDTFFAPFEEGSDSVRDLSKAVKLHQLRYADTEAEAIDGYNQMVEEAIQSYQKKISELEALKIDV